jgi:hypothetical protein
VTLVLDLPLPTWNRVLALSYKQRAHLKHLTYQLVSELFAIGSVSQTEMGSVLSGSSTPSLREDYLRMIGRTASSASATNSGERTLVVIDAAGEVGGQKKLDPTPLVSP